jgi:hypothetical protein
MNEFYDADKIMNILILNPSINYHYKQKTQNNRWLAVKTA